MSISSPEKRAIELFNEDRILFYQEIGISSIHAAVRECVSTSLFGEKTEKGCKFLASFYDGVRELAFPISIHVGTETKFVQCKSFPKHLYKRGKFRFYRFGQKVHCEAFFHEQTRELNEMVQFQNASRIPQVFVEFGILERWDIDRIRSVVSTGTEPWFPLSYLSVEIHSKLT